MTRVLNATQMSSSRADQTCRDRRGPAVRCACRVAQRSSATCQPQALHRRNQGLLLLLSHAWPLQAAAVAQYALHHGLAHSRVHGGDPWSNQVSARSSMRGSLTEASLLLIRSTRVVTVDPSPNFHPSPLRLWLCTSTQCHVYLWSQAGAL